jgi:hypothetical protein
MLARGPSELGKEIQFIQFGRDSDQKLVERADRTLDRILQGIDMPKEIVQGLSNVRYANAVKIDEAMYKANIEPMALLLVDALTMVYLRPALQAKFKDLSSEAMQKLSIWYDPTEVVNKPDPADAAKSLHDKYALSNDALRRAHGFSDTDAPDEDELADRLMIEKATIPPEVVQSLLQHLIPSVFKTAREQNIEGGESPMPESAQNLLYPEESSSTNGTKPQTEESDTTGNQTDPSEQETSS